MNAAPIPVFTVRGTVCRTAALATRAKGRFRSRRVSSLPYGADARDAGQLRPPPYAAAGRGQRPLRFTAERLGRLVRGAGQLEQDGGHALPHLVVEWAASVPDEDRTAAAPSLAARGVLLAGGGALRPEFVHRLARRLDVAVKVAPAPDTAAVRGAAELLGSARRHPSSTGDARLPVPE
ncbi:hypothetical protein ACH5AL_11850 [Actinacidiphila glaucinigra]|uniref:hypothetical protein n=1 Tax=Actinacidiphila glaucinigra TaxID=235986 RepID=UPI0037BC89DB